MSNVTRWRDSRQKACLTRDIDLMPMLIHALDEFTKQEQQKAA